MSNENRGSNVGKCGHSHMSKVEGTEQADGSYSTICTDCGHTIVATPPKTERNADPRQMLTE